MIASVRAENVTDRSAPFSEGTTSTNYDHRQVFWLTDHPTNHAFSAVQRVACWRGAHQPRMASCGVRPRLQRRVHGGFSPPSLLTVERRYRQSCSIRLSNSRRRDRRHRLCNVIMHRVSRSKSELFACAPISRQGHHVQHSTHGSPAGRRTLAFSTRRQVQYHVQIEGATA